MRANRRNEIFSPIFATFSFSMSAKETPPPPASRAVRVPIPPVSASLSSPGRMSVLRRLFLGRGGNLSGCGICGGLLLGGDQRHHDLRSLGFLVRRRSRLLLVAPH